MTSFDVRIVEPALQGVAEIGVYAPGSAAPVLLIRVSDGGPVWELRAEPRGPLSGPIADYRLPKPAGVTYPWVRR